MNKIKRLFFTLSIILVLFALGIMAAETFSFLYISTQQSSLQETEYRTEKIEERVGILSGLEKKYDKVEPDIARVNTALPDQKDSSKLLADLNTLATGSGIKLTVLKSGNTAASGKKAETNDPSLLQTIKGKYSYELPLDVSLEGSFNAFQIFLKKVENYQRLINITAIDISKPSKPDAAPDAIIAKLTLTAYLKK